MSIPTMSDLRRIVEAGGPQTVQLSDLYDDRQLQDEDEFLFHAIDPDDLDRTFLVHEMTPEDAKTYLTARGDMTVFDAFKEFGTEEQEALVGEKAADYDADRIIVVNQKVVLDGNHHLIAGIMTNQPIKYINLADPPVG